MAHDIKRSAKIRREIALERLIANGPQHGKAATHKSARDKANCPKRQRKNKDWLKE